MQKSDGKETSAFFHGQNFSQLAPAISPGMSRYTCFFNNLNSGANQSDVSFYRKPQWLKRFFSGDLTLWRPREQHCFGRRSKQRQAWHAQRTWNWSFLALFCRLVGLNAIKPHLAGLPLNASSPSDSPQLLDVLQGWPIPLSQIHHDEIFFPHCWHCTAPGDIKMILLSDFLSIFSLLLFISLNLWCFTWHPRKPIDTTTEQHTLVLCKQTVTTQEDRSGKYQDLWASMAFQNLGLWSTKTAEPSTGLYFC